MNDCNGGRVLLCFFLSFRLPNLFNKKKEDGAGPGAVLLSGGRPSSKLKAAVQKLRRSDI